MNDIHHGDPLGGVHVTDNLHHLLPVHSPAPVLIINPSIYFHIFSQTVEFHSYLKASLSLSLGSPDIVVAIINS